MPNVNKRRGKSERGATRAKVVPETELPQKVNTTPLTPIRTGSAHPKAVKVDRHPDTLQIVVSLLREDKVVRKVVRTFKRGKHLSLDKMLSIESALMQYPAAEDDRNGE